MCYSHCCLKKLKGGGNPLEFDPILNFRRIEDLPEYVPRYKHLKVIGKIDYGIPYAKVDRTRIDCPIDLWLRQQPWYDNLLKYADHSCVQPTRENVKQAIDKMDRPKIHPAGTEHNDCYELAMKCADQFLSEALIAETGFNNSELQAKTGPGIVMKKYGCKTKAQALKHPKFRQRMGYFNDPLFYNSPKKEFLPDKEISGHKIRTFKIPDLDFLIYQKYLYDNQNEQFKKSCENPDFWCRYGFVKEYGGFHAMCYRLKAKYKAIYQADVSGWDRCLSALAEAYQLRNKYLKDKPWYTQWVTDHTVYSLEVDQDGYVFVNHQGNRSGQNDTTIDNCIAHVIIMFFNFAYIHKKIYGTLPTYEQLIEQGVNLFGDDNLSGLTELFNVPDFPQLMREAYACWGLVVKPGSDRFEEIKGELPDFEFLGQTIIFNEEFQRYVPRPRLGKIASSILFSEGEQDLVIYAQKIIGLCYLCYAVEEVRTILFDILHHLLTLPVIRASTPTIEQIKLLLKDEQSIYSRVWGFE